MKESTTLVRYCWRTNWTTVPHGWAEWDSFSPESQGPVARVIVINQMDRSRNQVSLPPCKAVESLAIRHVRNRVQRTLSFEQAMVLRSLVRSVGLRVIQKPLCTLMVVSAPPESGTRTSYTTFNPAQSQPRCAISITPALRSWETH